MPVLKYSAPSSIKVKGEILLTRIVPSLESIALERLVHGEDRQGLQLLSSCIGHGLVTDGHFFSCIGRERLAQQ